LTLSKKKKTISTHENVSNATLRFEKEKRNSAINGPTIILNKELIVFAPNSRMN
jgi:hypothetical protein